MMSNTAQEPNKGQGPGGRGTFAGRAVARVGYGAMQLDRHRYDRGEAVGLVRRALELGVDHIDTAQYYGEGFVNDVLREALRPEDDVLVVTKVGWEPDADGPLPLRLAQRPEQLRKSVHENLRALGLDQLAVVNLRRLDVGPAFPAAPDQVVDLDDQLAEMVAMRDEGLVGDIGLSTVSMEVLQRGLPAGIACVSNAYSLVDRSDESMLELCRDQEIAWVPYFPLGSAFPGFAKVADDPSVRSAASDLGVTPAQIGLAWLLHHDTNTFLIPGTASVGHLEANIAAGDVHLDPALVERLDNLSTP